MISLLTWELLKDMANMPLILMHLPFAATPNTTLAQSQGSETRY